MEVAADTEDDRVAVGVADIAEALPLPVEVVADIAEVLLDEVVEVDIAVGALQVEVVVDIVEVLLLPVEVVVDIRDEVARVIREVLLDTVDHQAVALAGVTMEAHLHLDQVEMDIVVGALQGEDTKDHLDLEDMNPEKVHLEAHPEKDQEADIDEMMGDTSPMTEIVRVVHPVEMVILEDLDERDNIRKGVHGSPFFMLA